MSHKVMSPSEVTMSMYKFKLQASLHIYLHNKAALIINKILGSITVHKSQRGLILLNSTQSYACLPGHE